MPDNKNLFDFGTGSIDKDQWLRDIDDKLEDFISMYGSAANKHRTTLLRQAFQDLRARIANGDMLNRTADGLYQFGSALNREDKHMLEAYQRALGFMGKLARTQIKAPTPPEEKKYGTTTLLLNWLKYLNPSGKFNEKAYWAEGDDASRIAEIKKFLEQEKNGLGAYTGYEGYKDRADLESRILSFLDNPTERNLQRLGFDSRNWIIKPTEETTEEAPKSELEQALERYNAAVLEQQVAQLNLQIQAMNAPLPVRNQLFLFTPSNYWTYDSYIKNLDLVVNALKETNAAGRSFLKALSPLRRTPTGDGRTFILLRTSIPTAWNGEAAEQARTYAQQQYNAQYHNELNNFFKGLGVNYQSYINNLDKLRALQTNLAKLFTVNPEGSSFISPDTISKYFVKNEDGTYGLKGTNLSYDPQGILYQTQNIDNYKEGGVIKGEDGLILDSSRYIQLPTQQNIEESKNENSQLSNSESARIAATIADIASMGAAFVPGYGTAASAVLGLGSTATNFGADLSDGVGLWDATKNAGFGLAADVMGLIPGLGGVGKGAKIARNLMWAVPKMMQWVNTYQGLQNAREIKNSIMKLTAPSSMTVLDWLNVSQALQIMTGHSRSVATKVKKAGMTKTTTTTEPEHYIYTNKGKQKVSDETFKRLREIKGVKNRLALTEELMGQGVTLNLTRFAPWNTSIRFGAFKEVPGKTKMEVQNKHKGWFSDENLVLKAENINPSVDIRSILTRINPYRAYYSGRNQPVVPERNYSKLSIFPTDAPLNIHNTTPKVQPHPTGEKYTARPAEQPKAQPNPQSKKKHKRRKHEIGGILYALRNGGIIKAQWGDDTSNWMTPLYTPESLKQEERAIYTNPYFPDIKYNGTAPWYKSRFSRESVANLGNDASRRADLPGGLTGNNLDYAFARNQAYVKSGLLNKLADILGYFDLLPSPVDANNLLGLTDIYNEAIDELYLPFTSGENVPDYLKTDATKHNLLFRQVYGSRAKVNGGDDNYDIGWNPDIIKTFGSASFARRPVNYETKWEDDLKNNLALAKDRVSKISHNGIEGYVYTDENGRIHPLTNDLLKLLNGQQAPQELDKEKESSKVADSERGDGTIISTNLKNPFDPTPLIVAGKTIQGLLGNRNIYKNLLDEMPLAPLRDPIDRKLAIVGWQERIKHGQNQLADLRRILQLQLGSDLQTNFATALETERTGRDIMDKAFMEDSGRQFETALKSWNLDNEDYLYNIKVGDDNRKAIADRARMMAQIRAAWRSGNNNILMGALADTGNWLMKKYQREQDLVDKAKEIQLGSPEERAQADLYENDSKYAAIMDKYLSGESLSNEERTYVKVAQARALRNIRGNYSLAYYNTYHNPMFGGGYRTVIYKNGSKLEIEKLKARGRDNDRYVSMIKDLRPSRRRRRR